MSGMRRPLGGDFVKCKRLEITTKGVEIASHCPSVLVEPFLFDAFSLREPASTSLENALPDVRNDLARY
jgi:hypothetical protein